MGKLVLTSLVLAKMIEKLELKEVASISKTPRTSAACLHNIKKCLAFLRDNKPKVEVSQLFCEQAILEGDPLAIIAVVEELYKAYGITISKIDQKM